MSDKAFYIGGEVGVEPAQVEGQLVPRRPTPLLLDYYVGVSLTTIHREHRVCGNSVVELLSLGHLHKIFT